MRNPEVTELLSGVWAKLNRVEVVLPVVNEMAEVFYEGYDKAILVKRSDNQLLDEVFYNISDPLPLPISVIVGECLHNLRSALDHLITALAVADRGEVPSKLRHRLAFPITTNAYDFACAAKDLRHAVSPDALTELEWLQPYNRNLLPSARYPPGARIDATEQHSLRLLQRWSNTDKHRALHLAFTRFKGGSHPTVGELKLFYPQRVEYGTKLAEVAYDTPPAHRPVDVDIKLYADVALDEPYAGWSVRIDIGNITNRIRNEVIPRFSHDLSPHYPVKG